jgi:hypothetical protein
VPLGYLEVSLPTALVFAGSESIAERRGWPEMQALLEHKPFSR